MTSVVSKQSRMVMPVIAKMEIKAPINYGKMKI